MSVCLIVCKYKMCTPGTHRSQKKMADPLELGLWIVVNDHVGSREPESYTRPRALTPSVISLQPLCFLSWCLTHFQTISMSGLSLMSPPTSLQHFKDERTNIRKFNSFPQSFSFLRQEDRDAEAVISEMKFIVHYQRGPGGMRILLLDCWSRL